VQYHVEKEHWNFERIRFREALASELRNEARKQALVAMPALIEVDSEYIADSKGPLELLRRCVDQLSARDRLTPEAAQVLDRVEQVRERIYRNCRTACGAETLSPEPPENKYDSMSEDELQSELDALRRRAGWTPPPVQ
jgi:hypothetical protein